MAKYKRGFTPDRLDKFIRQGRGQGAGQHYKPWLTVRDVPSRGLSSRLKGWKTGRSHHLLSQLELSYFLILEWSQTVIDIREQYPLLPRQQTLDISDDLNIKHPTDPTTQCPIVMTTDFLIDTNINGKVRQAARSIKPASDLGQKRTIEKLQIERTFWQKQGIDWGVVTELDIDKTLAENINYIHCTRELDSFSPVTTEDIVEIIFYLADLRIENFNSIAKLGQNIDTRFKLPSSVGLWAVRHLIANSILLADMSLPLLDNLNHSFRIIVPADLSAYEQEKSRA